MSGTGLVDTGVPVPAVAAEAGAALHLGFQDTLAAGPRLWVRGRVSGVAATPPANGEARRWWQRRRKREPEPAPATLRLETRISGSVFEAELPLRADGRFEATFTGNLPPARRGWRVARNRVSCGRQTAEACNVVLLPPEGAAAAILVVLPLDATWPVGGVEQWARSKAAQHLPSLMRKLQRTAGRRYPIYYLACVPPDSPDRRPELALAATALGWPTGHFIPMPTERKDALAAFVTAFDRLRWLFAGTLDLWVLNWEPAAASVLTANLEPKEDRAAVHPLSDRKDVPSQIQDQPAAERAPGRRSGSRPIRAALLPRHPIVFCHGMLAYSFLKMSLPEEANYLSPLGSFLRQRGLRVLFPEVPATSGVVERAASLREQILRWTDEPVNLIGHSMGGLDARYLITHLGMADRVRSLTTICTPHHGSYLAVWFQDNYRQRVPLLLALEALGFNVDGFRDCRPDVCREFNARTPDMPQVRYFSFGGEVQPARLTPFLRRAWTILTQVEGPNDGLVSVASAHWGEYLGTIHADHFAQTPDGVFLRPGEDFDSLRFFVRLVEDLARRGF
jgi:triacylglycerol lipase